MNMDVDPIAGHSLSDHGFSKKIHDEETVNTPRRIRPG